MSDDPFLQVLRVFFETALPPKSSPAWSGIKSALSSSEEQFPKLYAFLLQNLLEDYNCRLLLKSSHIDLHKNPSYFPPVFVEHYNTSETMGWCWKRWVVLNWAEMDSLTPPELGINFGLADEVAKKLINFMTVEKVVSKPKWRMAAVQFNPKDMLEKSVKYILLNYDANINLQHSLWKVEVAMKSFNGGDNSIKESQDSRVLLAHCIFRLCKSQNYSIVNSNDVLQIPDSIPIPPENILVSFTSQKLSPSSAEEEKIVVEINSKDYYSQYSETVVILYNYARIKTILERYDGLAESQEYPKLPPLDNIDFNLIGESKDEFPIILMLFMWPRVRDTVINIRRKGKGFAKINLPFLFDFIKSLARAFDSFYNRNVVIVPPSAPHNFRSMFSRLYLLKALAVVFKDFIYLSGIQMD